MATLKSHDQLQPSPISTMRKTLSLSVLFRTERAVRARPSSDAIDDINSSSTYDTPAKRRKRLSLRRSPASTTSSAFSSPGGRPQSICSTTTTRSSTSKRISRVASRCLFPDSLRLDEEQQDFIPPQRPSCPAPLLDLSFEGLSLHDDVDRYELPYVTRLRTDGLGRLSVTCPSEESFHCRGLQEGEEEAKKILPRHQNRRRPTMTSILAPSALKLRPKTSFLAVESDASSSSTNSSVYSFETTPEIADQQLYTTSSSSWTQSPQQLSSTLGLMCPPSPPPKVRLQLTLPPSANLTSHLTVLVDSNATTLELKETLCSTLLDQFEYSISPSSIALAFICKDDEPARILENSHPLYQEGLQDDDDILVRF